ncbi:MarR family winged helix-turn-helix transcriptional regulator [Gracilibacillus marinus]|uniref:MarR family winged helix-turn-helix transcriptional regulator n=1 Tax=Gracilibacillus marinus TaxID=630535 RepID=A0ABV8VP62_9BACI
MDTNLFRLIHMIQQMNNENIIQFTKAYPHMIGISPILALVELKVNGPLKPIELADKLGFTKGAITNITTKLLSLQFVDKIQDENDKRSFVLSINNNGIRALQNAQQIGENIFITHFEVLTDEELQQYLHIQKKLIHGMEKRKMKSSELL